MTTNSTPPVARRVPAERTHHGDTLADPYAWLEPGTPDPTPVPVFPEVSATRALLRGARKRCPRCGERDTFVSWFQARTSCPRCDLRFEKEEGGFLGAMTLNYLFTAVVWLVVLVVWLAMDLPDLHVPALTVTSIAIAALVPLLFWPFSKTIWASVDFLIYRTSPDYGSREAADRSSGNGGRS